LLLLVLFVIATVIQVCDANVEFVEENLADAGGAFLPDNFWCPWSSRVLEEVGNETVIISDEPSMMPDDNETAVPSMEVTDAPSSSFPVGGFPTSEAPVTSPTTIPVTLPPAPSPTFAPAPVTPPPSSAMSLLSSSSSWEAIVLSSILAVWSTVTILQM
jgi:hypothetical protein